MITEQKFWHINGCLNWMNDVYFFMRSLLIYICTMKWRYEHETNYFSDNILVLHTKPETSIENIYNICCPEVYIFNNIYIIKIIKQYIRRKKNE